MECASLYCGRDRTARAHCVARRATDAAGDESGRKGRPSMNRARAVQVMEKYELDGLVATTTENFTYLSDYFEAYPPLTANPPRTNWQRRFFAVLPRALAAEVGVIVPRVNLLYAAQAQPPVQDIRSY